ncbi:hypothetical protein DM01DRAFT_1334528 [Hesseltinella vesiculosa]|uniref:Uncharacterized protein n=1 Tax=Hesseltinella vesiculosa TaxID=101127 RepID=A0A1X2GM44_9FUNG|nr:hypothetical protein DM01DRAFT_1334528 [Hesseltinella vesiculosa]
MALDQLTNYARRASNTSLPFSSHPPQEDTQAVLADKIHKVQHGTEKTLLTSLNGSAMGLSRINEHVHRRVPELLQQASQWKAFNEQVQQANADLKDAGATLSTLERADALAHTNDMARRCQELVSQLK